MLRLRARALREATSSLTNKEKRHSFGSVFFFVARRQNLTWVWTWHLSKRALYCTFYSNVVWQQSARSPIMYILYVHGALSKFDIKLDLLNFLLGTTIMYIYMYISTYIFKLKIWLLSMLVPGTYYGFLCLIILLPFSIPLYPYKNSSAYVADYLSP